MDSVEIVHGITLAAIEVILRNSSVSVSRFQNGVRQGVRASIDHAVGQICRTGGNKVTGNGIIARIDNRLIIHSGINRIVPSDVGTVRVARTAGTEVKRGVELHNLDLFGSEGISHRMGNLRTVEHRMNHHLVGRNRRVQHVLKLHLDVLVVEGTACHRIEKLLGLDIITRDIRNMDLDRDLQATTFQVSHREAGVDTLRDIRISTGKGCHRITRFLLAVGTTGGVGHIE